MEKTGALEVLSFRTSRVVFFLVPQAERRDFFRDRREEVERTWAREIQVEHHSGR